LKSKECNMPKKKSSRKWVVIGAVLIIVAVIAVIVWMRLPKPGAASAVAANMQTVVLERGSLSAVVGATGTVRSNQSAVIAWQTSGKVGSVMVKMGDQVKVDEDLASLDPNTISQNIIQAQTDLINAEKALDDLYKPQPLQIAQAESNLDDAKTALDTLLNPSELALTQAQQAVLDAQSAVDDAQKAVDGLYNGRGDQQSIESARAAYLLAQDKVDHLQDIYDHTHGEPDTDANKALALSNLAAAKKERDRALAALNWYLGSPTESEIAEKESALALAQAQLADAQDALEKLQAPSEVDIQLAQARVDDAQKTLDDLKSGPTADDVTVAQNRITLAHAALNQANLTAPFTGTITAVNVMPGDMVNPGQTAFRIDDLSKLFVDLQVSEIDMPSIQVGQAVSITFDALPNQEYSGLVTGLGLVGSLDQGSVFFPVTVQLTNADEAVKSGMTAVANIVVSEVDNVLKVPNRAIQTSDGQRFVYILGADDTIQKVTVTVGLASDTMSEVSSDQLKEGDKILVNVPTQTNTMGPGMFFGRGGN
jgi:HlyD family secretion protein